MNYIILISVIALSAILHLYAEYSGKRGMIYTFKPLTILLIGLIAFAGLLINGGEYPALILAGLGFSLLGDIFMMLVPKRFIEGLISFLIAHLFYISAFTGINGPGFTFYLFLFFLAYAAGMYSYLYPGLGKYRIAVIIYIVIITVMVWQAGEIMCKSMINGGLDYIFSLEIFAGAVLFVISDSALAVNKFRRKLPHSQTIIMTTYYLAQLLIACSVLSI